MKLKKTFNVFGVSVGLIYVLFLSIFLIWMLFFDENSFLRHREYNKEINELETSIEFYKKRISEDRFIIEKLQDSLLLERYAREKYFMKKENEDVFIIEFDTIKK